MNLRLSKNSLRFRINRKELSLLENQQNLYEEINLPNKNLVLQIIIKECNEMELIDDDNKLTLLVTDKIINFLVNNFPSKEGFYKELPIGDDELKISLQVDYRVSKM